MNRQKREHKRIARLRDKGELSPSSTIVTRCLKAFERWYRKATLHIVGRLLRVRPRTTPLDASKIRSVLILRRDGIGDIIVSSGVWRSLKHQYPHLKIGIAGSFRNLDLVRLDPDVDIRYDFSFLTWRDTLREIRRCRKEQWDVVLCLTATKRTNAAFNARIAAPHAIDTTIADPEHQPRYTVLFDIAIRLSGNQTKTPMLDFLREHVTGVFGFTPSEDDWHPSLFIDPVAVSEVSTQLTSITNGNPFVLLNTEASEASREWGGANSLALSKALTESHPNLFVLWLASPQTAERAMEELRSQPIDRVGYLPTRGLHQLAAAVQQAALVISPDTSIVHFAVALHKPIVGLYLSRNPFAPYNVPNRVFYPKPGDPMSTIPVEHVVGGALELLEESGIYSTTSPEFPPITLQSLEDVRQPVLREIDSHVG